MDYIKIFIETDDLGTRVDLEDTFFYQLNVYPQPQGFCILW